MAMEPASNPQGAVARDNGMMAAAPRRNALRGISELDITLYNQKRHQTVPAIAAHGLNNLAHFWRSSGASTMERFT